MQNPVKLVMFAPILPVDLTVVDGREQDVVVDGRERTMVRTDASSKTENHNTGTAARVNPFAASSC
jgi:hypothetical protein